ncbi:putative calcium-activated potassium channel subunit beta [Varanus komodoensis]|uniref:Potassium calcium-activated channel subfamily M regulatory beta subunit 1 n=1 Tax=Varanus komodoensis TaxID=61221 RepID=A0A8D2LAB8_VARKO|nr:putative calcium-activated potassium channel subunit beta [Varanus komodoensis]
MAKKLVTAQKRGETRAICLGLGMVACSVFMYFFIGVTIVPLYQRSVWTKESVCKLMKASLEKKVQFPFSEGFGDENTFHYPCLKVQVNLTRLGKLVMLHHTEDTVYRNPKCSFIPPNTLNHSAVQKLVKNITDNFRRVQIFPCYYDPSREEKNALLCRLYSLDGLIFAFFWPTLMLLGGVLIVIMVKVSQYFSVLSASQSRTEI